MARKFKQLDPDQLAEQRIKSAAQNRAVVLELGNLGISALPESIGQLAQLQSLNLSGNKLSALCRTVLKS